MAIEMLKETASQTAGPYLHIGMMPAAAGAQRLPLELSWQAPPECPSASTAPGSRPPDAGYRSGSAIQGSRMRRGPRSKVT